MRQKKKPTSPSGTVFTEFALGAVSSRRVKRLFNVWFIRSSINTRRNCQQSGNRAGISSVPSSRQFNGTRSDSSQGVSTQRRNLQHGEEEILVVLGIMFRCGRSRFVAVRPRGASQIPWTPRGKLLSSSRGRDSKVRLSQVETESLVTGGNEK